MNELQYLLADDGKTANKPKPWKISFTENTTLMYGNAVKHDVATKG